MIKYLTDKVFSFQKKINTKIDNANQTQEVINLVKHSLKYSFAKTTTEYNILQFIKSYDQTLKKKTDGALVECGVWKGIYLVLFRKLDEINNIKNRKIYGYDTFEGTPEPLKKYNKYNVDRLGKSLSDEYFKKFKDGKSGWNNTKIDEVKMNFDLNVNDNKNLYLIKGKVEKTLLDEKNIPDSIAILKIDTALYESYQVSFKRLANKVSKNGIIIIDNYLSYAGIKKATDEYIMENNFEIKIDKYSRNAVIYK